MNLHPQGFLIVIACLGGMGWSQPDTQTAECTFKSRFENLETANPYLILIPGWRLVLEGTEKGRAKRVEWLVLDETQMVDGVETRVVREREWLDGELYEESRNFLAICEQDRSVWNFGEEETTYAGGQISKTENWHAGLNGAARGLEMPGRMDPGRSFYREWVPGVEEETVEIQAIISMTIDRRVYRDAVVFKEISALEGKTPSESIYVPGIGLAKDDEGLLLVSWGFEK